MKNYLENWKIAESLIYKIRKLIINDLTNKQDKLTNPLTQSDVVNNLISASTTKPLSAYQGNVLATKFKSKTVTYNLNTFITRVYAWNYMFVTLVAPLEATAISGNLSASIFTEDMGSQTVTSTYISIIGGTLIVQFPIPTVGTTRDGYSYFCTISGTLTFS